MATSSGSTSSGATRSAVNTPSSDGFSSLSFVDTDDKIIEIAAQGDVLLRIEHKTASSRAVHFFRASTTILKSKSKYFERLLRSGRFSEAADVEAKHKAIREQYGSIAASPPAELPILNIRDIGRISAVKTLDALLTDFLYILHEKDAQIFPPIVNFANLAIVADRFDALDVVKSYFKRKKMIRALDGRTTPKWDANLTEEKVRQRILVAVLLDYPPWVEKYSARLITKGWVGRDSDVSTPLWWDLPSRIEEELAYRRECILETIQSVQSHFCALYTARDRQCRLCYDNSMQCDSFQLGEMVRFFTRVGTLQLQGTIFDANESPTPYHDDLFMLLDVLRQVPEYQIDRFHNHCGIRTRITPLLDLLQECFQYIGICPECWQEARGEYAWIESKRPLLWKRLDLRLKPQGHSTRHADIQAMFTATERHWK